MKKYEISVWHKEYNGNGIVEVEANSVLEAIKGINKFRLCILSVYCVTDDKNYMICND